MEPELNVVTGAFGYSGSYITERLLSQGKRVRTLTGHPDRPNPFGGRVEAVPFNFDDLPALVESVRGATTLFNTYWVRFSHGGRTFEEAVSNTKTLIRAAEEAGVRRLVHVSITNADGESPLPYFRGKGELERVIAESKLSYAIIRPTVIFGREDILINNIAWLLRRFPVFVVLGNGEYRLQPVYVEDMADMAVAAAQRDDNEVFDAVGPETFSFDSMVRLIRDKIGSWSRIIHLPPGPALLLSRGVGRVVGDVVLTQQEVAGLMAGLLVSKAPPTGRTRLSDWLDENAATVGSRYASELARHYR